MNQNTVSAKASENAQQDQRVQTAPPHFEIDEEGTIRNQYGAPVAIEHAGRAAELVRRANAAALLPVVVEALERLAGISWSAGSLAFEDAVSNARAALAKAKEAGL